jgi:tRNA (guanine-N7-)-methyltransferase
VDELLPRIAVKLPPDDSALDPLALFPEDIKEVWLEVGFGRGEHLASQAKHNPDIGMIGCEPFINGVAGLLQKVDEEGLKNVRILHDDARLLLKALPDASISRFFLLFPDPWPKTRHHKRRFVSPENLGHLARVLKDDAEFRFGTDHMDYCRWTLVHLLAHPGFEWTAEGPDDWRVRPADWPPTRYESKALNKGLRSAYLTFRRRPRA